MEKINVAIAGATGAVGTAMREILEDRDLPINELALLASERSFGKRFQFQGKSIRVQLLDDFDFSNTQIALFSAGGSVSVEHSERAALSGAIVVDNTSAFRYDDDVPLEVGDARGVPADSQLARGPPSVADHWLVAVHLPREEKCVQEAWSWWCGWVGA